MFLNGSSLPVTYTDYSHATVQVHVAGDATGTLKLTVQNPAPGGGNGTTVTETIDASSISLTATDADGTNTGTAELGSNVTLTAAVEGSMDTAVNWNLAGAGAISDGVYSPPSLMPANRVVTITAALASNPAITASYQLYLHNPVPEINSANPESVPPGVTTSVTLNGSGFVPGTVILANGVKQTAVYQSSSSVVVTLHLETSDRGDVKLQAQNPSPGGGDSLYFEEAISSPISATAAARLLDQTTFGPTTSLIQHVQGEGVTAWLAEQFNTPTTLLPSVSATNFPAYCGDAFGCTQSSWWQVVLTGNDQLRQRVAFALSQLFVVSVDTIPGAALSPYANMLANDAFTNWYTITHDVTLSPAMGIYLNMLGSVAGTNGQIANENYARENLQLFNTGLDLLNNDGTLQLDKNGNPIPTYTEAQVQAFARVYTGWTYAMPDGSTPTIPEVGSSHNYQSPMAVIEQWHDESSKTLLNGTTLPAGQTPDEDLAGALTNVFQHPNTPPFVCTQLIKHLVTSNPSPGYVSRVATVFENNGNNVRGDMKAVLTAIFTDPEARAGDVAPTANEGHLREPNLWMSAVMRGLGYVNVDPNDFITGCRTPTR